MAKNKKTWADLSPTQRTLVVVGGAAEIALTTYVLADLARRPAEQVRGRKGLWALAAFLQPVGPVAYLVRGRTTR